MWCACSLPYLSLGTQCGYPRRDSSGWVYLSGWFCWALWCQTIKPAVRLWAYHVSSSDTCIVSCCLLRGCVALPSVSVHRCSACVGRSVVQCWSRCCDVAVQAWRRLFLSIDAGRVKRSHNRTMWRPVLPATTHIAYTAVFCALYM